MMPKDPKIIVLHPKVFPHDPRAVLHLGPNRIVVPSCALDEFNRDKEEGHRHLRDMARFARRNLESFVRRGACEDWVALRGGGFLFLDSWAASMKMPGSLREALDLRVLALAKHWTATEAEREHPRQVILMVRDTRLLLRASECGVAADYYEHRRSARRYGMRKQKAYERKAHSFA